MSNENNEDNKALAERINENTKNSEEFGLSSDLIDFDFYLNERRESQKRFSEKFFSSRESIVSSSSSSPKNSDGRLGVTGDKNPIFNQEDSLPNRFESYFGVSYYSDHERLKKAAWVLKRRVVLEWIRESGISYLARLHRELEDNDYKIPKQTLSDFLEYLCEIDLVDVVPWWPKSRKYHYTKFIISPECPDWQIKRVLGERIRADLYYYKRSLSKNAEELKSEAKIRGIAQSEGFREARNEFEKSKERCEHGNLINECNYIKCKHAKSSYRV